MEYYYGKAASNGIAFGKIIELTKKEEMVSRFHISNEEDEIERFLTAKDKAVIELDKLYQKALNEVGEANAAIFQVHQMMLEDSDYIDSVINIISVQKVNSEFAVAETSKNFAEMFSNMDNDYMKERAADIKDISERLIAILEQRNGFNLLNETCIVVADDLVPSETVQLDKEKVLAFVTRNGSVNSHTAILAKTMNIPAIVNVQVPGDLDGKIAIVNADKNEFIVEPDEAVISEFKKKQDEELKKRDLLTDYKGKPTITRSGKEIKLFANIAGVGEVGYVLENDAAGVGLFRSEFLYLQSDQYPTEEEQFKVYKTVAEMLAGKKVIIRTLDIGADKQVDYFNLDKEENPAMGYRAIRICLDRIDLFKTQLSALCRACFYGNISIMIPMITSLWEVKRVKEILSEVLYQLEQMNIPHKEPELGIMIETPAAAILSEELAREVDFFSIGTNDLTQYTLAVDRQNSKLEMFYDTHHPAVLQLIQLVITNAHKAGIWAGICGELGADTSMTQKFVQMGIDELSVSPSMILPIRKIIRELE